jgi:hypothetical protein
VANTSSWTGIGIISPKGLFLEAIGEHSDYILRQLEERPRGSRLVMIEARLKPITKSEYRKLAGRQFGLHPKNSPTE